MRPAGRVGLTIGQAAGLVGVTIKTIRHHHRVGVLPEPARDAAGYRRYTSTDVLLLVRVRTLAEAGVPLAGVPELLAQSPREFAASVSEVDRRLEGQIRQLRQRRAMLRRLCEGDGALLPEESVAALTRLQEWDFPPEFVVAQREAMVLTLAVAPHLLAPHAR